MESRNVDLVEIESRVLVPEVGVAGRRGWGDFLKYSGEDFARPDLAWGRVCELVGLCKLFV